VGQLLYYLEVNDFPERSLVLPANYPEPRKAPVAIKARILDTNGVYIDSGTGQATVYLSPETVNFAERITVNFRGRSDSGIIEPSIEVMLEDARTRADRQHPFWAKVNSNDR